eukprot:g3659.t1
MASLKLSQRTAKKRQRESGSPITTKSSSASHRKFKRKLTATASDTRSRRNGVQDNRHDVSEEGGLEPTSANKEDAGILGQSQASKKSEGNSAEEQTIRQKQGRHQGQARRTRQEEEAWLDEARPITPCAMPLNNCALHPLIKDVLRASHIMSLFAIQGEVLEWTLAQRQSSSTRDLCVQAPTGSGKTLAYVLPIVQSLSERIVRRLRALVLLPTRDLAAQVMSIFESFCRPLGLHVEQAVGQRAFLSEQAALVDDKGNDMADILVCTPGRLVDHLQGTVGFGLRHVRYLVLDEADRLIMQRYQNWTEKVFQALDTDRCELNTFSNGSTLTVTGQNSMFESTQLRVGKPSTLFAHRGCQKLLFSATLMSNPQQLARLSLTEPLLFVATLDSPSTDLRSDLKNEQANTAKFSIPAELTEQLIVTQLPQKPLTLIHLLRTYENAQTLLFTSTLEASHRLYRLLEIYGGVQVAKFSSDLSQDMRSKVVRRFRRGKLRVLVCSDAMARGMDIENVTLIINYDVPVHVKTYLHRVGRTARAHQAGLAITLLQSNQFRHFRSLLQQATRPEGKQWEKIQPDAGALEALVPMYILTLSALRSVLSDEQSGILSRSKPLSQEQLMTYRSKAAAASSSGASSEE